MNMLIGGIILIIFTIAMITLAIVFLKKENIIGSNSKEQEKEKSIIPEYPDFSRSRVLLEIDNPVEKINGLIDSIIKDAINMYNIQNPSLDKNYQYIKTDEVDNSIVPYVYITAMKCMTPDVVSVISLVYYFEKFDIDKFLNGLTTDNYIPDDKNTNTLEWLIYTRTKLAVIDFVSSVNA